MIQHDRVVCLEGCEVHWEEAHAFYGGRDIATNKFKIDKEK